MEDKTFELMTKLYNEFTGFRKETGERFGSLENTVKKIQIKIEHGLEPKIQALYEDRDIIHKRLDSIEKKVDDLKEKSDNQEIEIKLIKGGKGRTKQL